MLTPVAGSSITVSSICEKVDEKRKDDTLIRYINIPLELGDLVARAYLYIPIA